MKTIITIEVEDGITEQQEKDLRYLLCDALGEFCHGREDAQSGVEYARAYVEKRYPNGPYTGTMEEKAQQVHRRCVLAEVLRNSAARGVRVQTVSEINIKQKDDK